MPAVSQEQAVVGTANGCGLTLSSAPVYFLTCSSPDRQMTAWVTDFEASAPAVLTTAPADDEG